MRVLVIIISFILIVSVITGCNMSDLSIDPKPTTWCFVIDRTMPDEIQRSISKKVGDAIERRFIQMGDYVAIVVIGRDGTVAWDGGARHLREAKDLYVEMARFSGQEGSNIAAGLHMACRFLNEHPGEKRLVIVSDLVSDPYKRDGKVVQSYPDASAFDWNKELTDQKTVKVRIFGVDDETQEHLGDMLGKLRTAEKTIFRPSHRITTADLSFGKEE